MPQSYIQASFNSGEWAPHLWARTDLEKYHSGAALLENFFVDYRGGASTRSGTKYIIRGYKDSKTIRLIPFQAAVSVGYVLEFGDMYIRFHRHGAPVLETALNITGVSNTNPCVVSVANSYTTGGVDWVYITGVGGTTQLNGKYFILSSTTAGTVTLSDLFGNPVDATAFGVYSGGGTIARVFTLASPYAAADLALLKFTENVDVMLLTHPLYPLSILTFVSNSNWSLTSVTIGPTISPPAAPTVTTTLAGGTINYSYIVTAVNAAGDESQVSAEGVLAGKQDLRSVAGTNTITWTAVTGAIFYNVYKASVNYTNPVPAGQFYGFIGYSTATSLIDSNIVPDVTQAPPILGNPFINGGSVTGTTVTNGGDYTVQPTLTFTAPGIGGAQTATGLAVMRIIIGAGGVVNGGFGYNPGDIVTFPGGIVATVATTIAGVVQTITITNTGTDTTNFVATLNSNGSSNPGSAGLVYQFHATVQSILLTNAGTGYTAAPTISFSSGVAAATATVSASSVSNPSVPCFFQQRLVLANTLLNPEGLYLSQPGNYFNFNTSNPIQDTDAITATVVSGQLSNIKAMIPQPGGLIVYTDDSNLLINGGSLGAAVSPAAFVINPQSHVGCNDMPPIVVNFDILTVQSKGSSVRDATYNFYANVYTGADISITSSHLFFGHQLQEWAWVEEPYKLVWAVREDGVLLCLTFIKEQEFVAWTHHDTNGSFKSVATIVEAASVGFQNFLYTVVQRSINGTSVQYIEYMPERPVSDTAQDYWTVDCAIGFSGAPTTSFSGGEFLAGATVTGLADGVPITPFVMPTSGNFTLPAPASNVKIGFAFTCNLQTLFLDIGQPTIQSKQKMIPSMALRVTQTLGLKGGTDVADLVVMKDLVLGNVGSMTNQLVTGLVTGDAMMVLDPKWQEPGQIYIRQDQPYPASILGYIPRVNATQVKPG